MSFSVKNNKITLTRGDTFVATVEMNKDGEPYTPQEGDVIRFAVKHPTMNASKTDYADAEPLIEKVIPNGTLILQLDPEDTKPLGFGDYVYDIQITYANGRVDTFITTAQFKLTPEVE